MKSLSFGIEEKYIFRGLSTSLCYHSRLKISKEHNPSEKTRPRSASGRRERAVEPGLSVTAHHFSPKDPNTFVVGTLCGGLYKCNIDQAISVEGDLNYFYDLFVEIHCDRFETK